MSGDDSVVVDGPSESVHLIARTFIDDLQQQSPGTLVIHGGIARGRASAFFSKA